MKDLEQKKTSVSELEVTAFVRSWDFMKKYHAFDIWKQGTECRQAKSTIPNCVRKDDSPITTRRN